MWDFVNAPDGTTQQTLEDDGAAFMSPLDSAAR